MVKISILLIALFTASSACNKTTTSYADAHEERGERGKRNLKTFDALKAGDCFRFERPVKADFIFEKDFFYTGRTHVVIYKTKIAALIAQPDPDCSKRDSIQCEYWFRTLERNSLFLLHGAEKIFKCSSDLNKATMIKRLERNQYYNQGYNLKVIKGK